MKWLEKILIPLGKFFGWVTGITRLRKAEAAWIEEHGEIPDGMCLDCGWKWGATGCTSEYRCELRRFGSTGTDLPFSY